MHLFLFIATILFSVVVVRIGAVAFELTGIDWSTAWFQAVSCFTSTGFTTRESELIMGNPHRRKIAAVLMIIGNAGFVTLIASLVNALRPQALERTLPWLGLTISPSLIPWVDLATLIVVLFLLYRLLAGTRLAAWVNGAIRNRMTKAEKKSTAYVGEMLHVGGDCSVVSVQVREGHAAVGRAVGEGPSRDSAIRTLAVERKGVVVPNPAGDYVVEAGDRLVLFGNAQTIRKAFG